MSIFRNLKRKKFRTSVFNMPNTNNLTCKIGELIPFMWEEVVPGDTWSIRSEILAKFAPMTAPVMGQMDIYTYWFFCPNRLLFKEWEEFITGGPDGISNVPFPNIKIPNTDLTLFSTNPDLQNDLKKQYGPGSLFDHLGCNPIQNVNSPSVTGYTLINALPFRMYNLVYNEFFRDQNLEDPITVRTSSGNEFYSKDVYRIRQKKYQKDYFTSALPWTQRGGTVQVPLSGQMDVMLKDEVTSQKLVINDGSDTPILNTPLTSGSSGQLNGSIDPNGSLYTDLEDSGAGLNIETLRYSNALQRWLENNARYGSRYIEQLLARFGVVSSDARLQRPELIGGGKQNVLISEVLQTSSTDTTSPLGTRAGDANSYGQHKLFGKKFFEEHGIIMGIMCVVPKPYYFQGIPRKFSKKSKFDFFQPEFQTLGEQPILMKELYFGTNEQTNEKTFGYAPRYCELKFRNNEIHGDFKDNLLFWQLGRRFGNYPSLNNTFISINQEDIDDIFAVTDDSDKVYVQIYNHVKAKRRMMYNPSPSL